MVRRLMGVLVAVLVICSGISLLMRQNEMPVKTVIMFGPVSLGFAIWLVGLILLIVSILGFFGLVQKNTLTDKDG